MMPSGKRHVVQLYYVLLQTCDLCSVSHFWVSAYWSKSIFTAMNCRKGLNWHFLFINSHNSPLQFVLLWLVELLSIFKVRCLKVHSSSVNGEYPEKCCGEWLFSWFLTGQLVGRQRHVTWASYTRCFWNVFLICICSCGNTFGSLLMVQITHSVILNYF